ncbi:MAG: hypothetical protein HS111_06815 [Kofleriaceae bacterium]|nr:hypothetical protein [Kofleriaceae bacterium]MCL4225575.1 hypothetical protein [Myxococcales bacterium]
MTAADQKPRRRYEARGIGELRGPRSKIGLPTQDEATFLPDPRAAYDAILARFRAANGPSDAPSAFPNLSARDVRALANVITFALRNDLPSLSPYDAAVLWDKWREAVTAVRQLLADVRDHEATNASSDGVKFASVAIDHRGWDLRESLVTALASPGAVFERYCPWRSAWATFERLHPEAV